MNMYTQVEDLERILVMNDLKYRKEVAIKELNNKRFDYYLSKYKLFIEFDGAQHHYPVEHFGGNDRYIQQVFDDAEKTMWCRDNGYKFLRLNHLMSMETMIGLINDIIEMEITVNEADIRLPYIEEWAELNLNRKDLYINELYKNYNKFLKNIMGKNYKLNEIIPFEDYILNYNEDIEYKGIIQHRNEYTKHYVNKIVTIENTENILESNDIIDLFIENLEDIGILEYSHLPSKLIYEYYKDWLNNNNNNIYLMSNREFGQRFGMKIIDYGYMVKKIKRLNVLDTSQFNISFLYNQLTDSQIKNSFNEIFRLNPTSTIYISGKVSNLSNKDIVDLFIKNLEDLGILKYSHIPSKYMYEYYEYWNYNENISSEPMKVREFGQHFGKKIRELGYTKQEKKRITQLNKDQFDFDALSILINLEQLTNIYINENKINE